ncbi:MAG: YraN family protein [Clostridiales bacterium]|nr:YraN family protein [Clostridiales bacterium]
MEENKRYNKVYGDIGESIAKNYLIGVGYKIVKTNFKNKLGEIDIIAYDDDVLVFVEVKYRKNSYFGLPREAVNTEKQRKIRMVATSYINRYKLFNKACRFDVLEILDREVTLIKDCF